jgi:hypothetical protein
LPNPIPGVIDFAAWPIGSNRPGYQPAARFRGNVFYAFNDGVQDTTRWRGSEVFVQLPDGTRSAAGMAAYGRTAQMLNFMGHVLTGH